MNANVNSRGLKPSRAHVEKKKIIQAYLNDVVKFLDSHEGEWTNETRKEYVKILLKHNVLGKESEKFAE